MVAQPVSAQKRFFPDPRGKFQSNNSFRNQSYRRSTFVRQQKNDSFAKNPNNRSSCIDEGVTQSTSEAGYQLPKLSKLKPPDNLVAGRIKHFYLNWAMITTDPWILETVRGYKIPFVCQPRQWRKRHTKAKSKVDTSSIKEAISQLQLKGAIKINCTGTTEPIHINTVCCETSLKRKTNFQLKEFESVCTALQVQDGRSGYGTQAHSTRRLHDEVRPPGRLFLSANPRQLQTLSTVHLSGNNIRVPVPPMRAFQCTLDIHQTIETSHFTAAIAGDTNCNISG